MTDLDRLKAWAQIRAPKISAKHWEATLKRDRETLEMYRRIDKELDRKQREGRRRAEWGRYLRETP